LLRRGDVRIWPDFTVTTIRPTRQLLGAKAVVAGIQPFAEISAEIARFTRPELRHPLRKDPLHLHPMARPLVYRRPAAASCC
jgi:hypothetical protein